ncbi:hypothetical protein AKO1_012817 [Acrasis kona]|uniref:DNA repair metallo-beta-lactamase domain-containing protein n=1 Tax=Acrasis kona TaxID=1008807 RepID=A0AAW2YY74_9EUKA
MASADPSIKVIPENDFVVDGFTLKNKDDYKDWFLTHFHSDHYVGIQKKFNYDASSVTCKLVKLKLGVDEKYLKPLDFYVRYNIKGTFVTLMEANHCPGSAVILFELPSGRTILHTGDFRFNKKLFSTYDALKPFFSNSHHEHLLKTDPSYKPPSNRRKLDALYLDTTYCDPQYTFPEQEEAIQLVSNIVKAKKEKSGKVLFLIGTYHIGKEKVASRIAKECNCNIFVTYDKMRSIRCLDLSDQHIFTTEVSRSDVHVVPMCHLGWKKLFENQSALSYDEVCAFKPSAWCFKDLLGASSNCPSVKDENNVEYKQVPVQYTRKSKITLVNVPYSEHSSFTELQQCCDMLDTERIVPTVYRNQGHLKTIMYHLTEGRRFPNKMGCNVKLTIPNELLSLPGAPMPKKSKSSSTPVKVDSSVRTLFDMAKSGIKFVKKSMFGDDAASPSPPVKDQQQPSSVKNETTFKKPTLTIRKQKITVPSPSDDAKVIKVDDDQVLLTCSMLEDSQNVIDLDDDDWGDVDWDDVDAQVEQSRKDDLVQKTEQPQHKVVNNIVNVDDYESVGVSEDDDIICTKITLRKLNLKRKTMDSPSLVGNSNSKKTKVETTQKHNLFSFWGSSKK